MRRDVRHWGESRRRAALVIEPVAIRLPDRAASAFGEGRRERLTPIGRPSDIYSDVIVTVARVRAMEFDCE